MIDKSAIMYLLPDTREMSIKAGRLYFYLYNELFFSFSYKNEIETEVLLSTLRKKVPEMEVLHKFDLIVDSDSGYQEVSELQIIKLKEKVLLEIRMHVPAFFYGPNENINTYKEIIDSLYIKTTKAKFFNFIVSSPYTETGLDVEAFDVKEQIIDIDENYNDNFRSVSDNIIQFLNKDKSSGLVLLHGKQGTGKTTYIRHLISSINRTFIYLPSQLTGALSKPSFIPFIKRFKESILIIEDCENIIKSRESVPDFDNALANLLNMGDGLLSDALSLKIICTFNTDLRNIDQAILRKGRLKGRYEFTELSADKVVTKLKKLGMQNIEPVPMTLAEIYNYSETTFEINTENSKIGFR